jgi:hypothetical protein
MKIITKIKDYFKPKDLPIIPKIRCKNLEKYKHQYHIYFDANAEHECIRKNFHMLEFCDYHISLSEDFSDSFKQYTNGGIILEFRSNHHRQFDVFEKNNYKDYTLFVGGLYKELKETNIQLFKNDSLYVKLKIGNITEDSNVLEIVCKN